MRDCMLEIIYAVLALVAIGERIVLIVKMSALSHALNDAAVRQTEVHELRDRSMLVELHDGLAKQGDRLAAVLADSSERLRNSTGDELKQTRDTLHALRLTLSENLAQTREAILEK